MNLDVGLLLQALAAGAAATIVITAVAFCSGALLAVPIAMLRISSSRVLRGVAITYIEVFRGVPTLVWLLIIYYGLAPLVQLEPLAAACVGLGAIAAAYLAENYRAGLENISPGQHEAGKALGLEDRHVFWRIIAPQAVGVALPPSASYAMGLLKESAVASVIGVTDIIFRANLEVVRGQSGLYAFLVAGLLYFLLSVPIAITARVIDHKVRMRTVTV